MVRWKLFKNFTLSLCIVFLRTCRQVWNSNHQRISRSSNQIVIGLNFNQLVHCLIYLFAHFSVQTFKSAKAQQQHALAISEMYQSLKNHPSIIAWSLANEPLATAPEGRPYFQPLFKLMRSLDKTRPVTFVNGDMALPPLNYLVSGTKKKR